MESKSVLDEISIPQKRSMLPDPADLYAVLFRRRWIFFSTFAIVLLLAIAITLSLPKTYKATSALMLEPREAQPVKVNDRGFVAPADDNLIDTAVQVIRSPSLMLDVARQLKLVAGSQPENPGKPALSLEARERRAADALMSSVTARRVGVTYLVEISATSRNPREAADVANAVADRYIQLSSAQKQLRNTQSARYVESQAAALRKQAVADDAALQSYMVSNNLMSAQGATMAEQEVSELNRQIADAQAQLAEQRGKLRAAQAQIARGSGGADIGSALASETIRQLRQQEAQASAALAQADARYGERHPEVVQAREELNDVQRQLQAELNRILSGLRGDVQIAASRLSSLMESRSRARGTLAQNSSAQVGRLELERKADASRAIYNAYLTRAKETAQAGELPNADATIASMARIPAGPSSPLFPLCAAVGLLAALVAGLASIFIAEYLDRSLATVSDVEQLAGATYAGALPSLASASKAARAYQEPADYVVARPMSLFTESIRSLAAHLALPAQGGHCKVVTVTSAFPGEGKSTISMCLARALAISNHRVLLIDADVRRHSTSQSLCDNLQTNSLFDALHGDCPLEEAVIGDSKTGLEMLLTDGAKTPRDVLSEKALSKLIDNIKQRYDVVIIDTAPVLGVAETRIVSRLSDLVVLVAKWRKTPKQAVQSAIDLLQQSGAQRCNVTLNQVNLVEFATAGQAGSYGYAKQFSRYYID